MHQTNTGQLTNTIIRNTEIGRADKFIGNIKNTHCYIKETSQWHIFNGTVWEQDDKRLVQQKAMDFIKDEGRRIASIDDDNIREEARHDFTRHANRAAVNNLTELAAVQLVNTVGRFDTDRMAMAVENGWVDLNSCTFNPPDPDKLFSLQASVPYKATEQAKLWRDTVSKSLAIKRIWLSISKRLLDIASLVAIQNSCYSSVTVQVLTVNLFCWKPSEMCWEHMRKLCLSAH